MKPYLRKGLTVLLVTYKKEKPQISKGKIIGTIADCTNRRKWDAIEIKLEDGTVVRTTPVSSQLNMDPAIAILVPKKEIPTFWRKTLSLNPKNNLAVCYIPTTSPVSTTICSTKTLRQIESVIREESRAEIRLWEGQKKPSEGKPCLTEGETIYQIGNKEITLPEGVENY